MMFAGKKVVANFYWKMIFFMNLNTKEEWEVVN